MGQFGECMMTLDDFKARFDQRLTDKIFRHSSRIENELAWLRNQLLQSSSHGNIYEIEKRLLRVDQRLDLERAFPRLTKIQINEVNEFNRIDSIFFELFQIPRYYASNKIIYPTIYCETLEEFFAPFVADRQISKEAREEEQKQLVTEARQRAEAGKGGVYGVNFPGRGCYLNGWLFAYASGLEPSLTLTYDEFQPFITGTAVHEKLGHGFLSAYSALGEIKTKLGLTAIDIARRFGLLPADDPMSRILHDQSQLLSIASQLSEEGWSTWIEKTLGRLLFPETQFQSHSMRELIKALQILALDPEPARSTALTIMSALDIIFSEDPVQLSDLHRAVMVIEIAGLELDSFFLNQLGQPIRYIIGELICRQIEFNQGAFCVPYSVLIATNISFEPSKISLADLKGVFQNEPRLLPDTRLCLLSRLPLKTKGDINELAVRAQAELSLTIPKEIR
jgi:hypothetical protein